ncbi:LysR family transcriptional regulator, partial [Sphaerisporangium sp. NPDC088356]|uniref:LysR family transcriptional regulator n=1 Tax=Sphaerisporangium sp. NPDC088356 TaxID=3154871 RepID=UPI003445E46F
MLHLRRLALLCEFARRGSIAATAASLGYSASAVSQQLAALEREAGSVLLDRTSRSAELTEAGHRLVEHAERILAMVETAESDLSAHAATPSGRVVVTAFPTAAVAFAPARPWPRRCGPCTWRRATWPPTSRRCGSPPSSTCRKPLHPTSCVPETRTSHRRARRN